MRAVRLTLSRKDCLIIDVGRDWFYAVVSLFGIGFSCWIIASLDPATRLGKFALVAALASLITGVIVLRRSLARRHCVVVKTDQGLLLNGDPIEFARAELHLRTRFFGLLAPYFELSLWVMTLIGPEELPLGNFRSLIDASEVAGELEESLLAGGAVPHRVR